MLPNGVPFDSLSFLYLTSGHFLDFKNLEILSPFLTPPIFYPPLRELCNAPLWGPIWFVLFYILRQVTSLISKTNRVYRVFWPPIFYIDGWWDGMGWEDVMVGLFFFGSYLGNYSKIFLYYFRSLKYMFLHIFWNTGGKKLECSFFKIFRQNRQPPFSRKFLKDLANFSKTGRINIFSSLFLVTLE